MLNTSSQACFTFLNQLQKTTETTAGGKTLIQKTKQKIILPPFISHHLSVLPVSNNENIVKNLSVHLYKSFTL